MLDKLIDNAVDFHRAGTPIRVQLECYGDLLQIMVANRGAALSEERLHTIFDSMVSHRGPDNRLHWVRSACRANHRRTSRRHGVRAQPGRR